MASSPSPSTNQEGPTTGPPALPEGWLAQWEGQSKKYYYVQRATGHSQWDVPTQPALSVPTPDPTPQQYANPFPRPAGNGTMHADGDGVIRDSAGNPVETDRSLIGDLASNVLTGGKHKPQKQSGLGGLASSFLGGQGSHGSGGTGSGSHGGGSSSGGFGGLAGQLVGSFVGGGKPNKPQQQHQSSQHSTSGGQHGGFMNFLGGHHGSSNEGSNYGYSSSGQGSSSGGYTGQAPPASYQPPGQHGASQYGSPSTQSQQHQQGYQGPNTHQVHNDQYGSSGGHYQPSPQGYPGTGPNYSQSYNSSQISLQSQNASGAPPYGQPTATSHEAYGQPGQPGQNKPPHENQALGSQYNPQQAGYSAQNQSFPGPPSAPHGTSQSSTPAYGQQGFNPSHPPLPPSSSYGQQQNPLYSQASHSQQPTPYGQYPPAPDPNSYSTPSQNSYPPPPQNTPAYGAHQQNQGGPHDHYPPPPTSNPPYGSPQPGQGGYNPYPPAPPMSSHPSQQGPGSSNLGAPSSQYPPRPTSEAGYPGQGFHGQTHGQGPPGQPGLEPVPHSGYQQSSGQQPPYPISQQHGGGASGQWQPYRPDR